MVRKVEDSLEDEAEEEDLLERSSISVAMMKCHLLEYRIFLSTLHVF